jgi:hypothetical protein
MKKTILAISLVFAMMLPVLAFAADFKTETAGKNDNVRNLYIAGQNVNVDANVNGDLTGAGNIVNVNGNVEKSTQLAGSTVNIKGNVGDNLRVAASNLNVDGNVGEDAVVFVGQVTFGSGNQIAHDLILFGGSAVLNGTVKGKVVGYAGDVTINGTVDGDVDLKDVGKVTLGSNAVINGKLTYSSSQKSDIKESQVKNGVEFKQISTSEREAKRGAKAFTFVSLMLLVGSFLLLFVLVQVAPTSTEKYLASTYSSPWANLGIGFVTMIAAPVALILFMITVVGLPLAGFGFFVYIFLMVLAGILMSLVAGSWIVKVFKKETVYELGWLPILAGIVVVAVLKLVPVFGWMVVFLLFLLSLGGLVKSLYLTIVEERK